MNVIVVIPSLNYLANAGARIRYGRLVKALAERNVSLTLECIAVFDPEAVECDVVLFSKCHDARALICAHILSQRGILFGADIFDDYFGQAGDVRFNHLRTWLAQILSVCNFVLVSTHAIAEVILAYAPRLPCHVLNDPGPDFDATHLSQQLHEKRAAVVATGRLRVAWFGIGDNPHFSVGLEDLAAFDAHLMSLATGPWAVELTVLTNSRSLDTAGLARIRSLPIAATVEEWSEDREASLLEEAFVAFLPVNGGQFSRAKSLNRAVTALAAGCQVLSPGYPLYAALDPLIYYDTDELLDHIREDALRLSPTTLDTLIARFDMFASAAREAESFSHFLRSLGPPENPSAPMRTPLYLVHGAVSSMATHKMAQSVGGISVASPFCAAPFEFDVIVEASAPAGLTILVNRKAHSKLVPTVRNQASRQVRVAGRKYWVINPSPKFGQGATPLHASALALQLALYPSVMTTTVGLLRELFAADRIVIAENSPLPFTRDEVGNV